ncbi:MarR family transcriptional regulator [Aeromicrobium tamlense]|uniref:MarR family transcriptional regulator n=1 Tax=Aeromicrobium tamlense TaxID=375541 RepID=A0A8I0FZ73_9ACTN|nr:MULTISPECIES: MarR family transcriptional regulator [Aeromicrobium]MBD1271766.1 MarR family transcriptional regulator [Aeromicrobium tamlense]NYI37486.1 DNA-binding MarR family transcriptional regulator [Aeromicrobium tamlense]
MSESERWLDDDEAEAWLALVSILEVLPATLDSQLGRDADLTFFEFLVLVQLAETHEDSMRLTDLATAMNTTPARLSRVVTRLEHDGLLLRTASPDDGRSRHARLTPSGWERLEAASPGHVDLVREVFVSRLTREQLGQVRRIGDRLLAGLDPGQRVLAGTRGSTRGRQGLSRFPERPRAED